MARVIVHCSFFPPSFLPSFSIHPLKIWRQPALHSSLTSLMQLGRSVEQGKMLAGNQSWDALKMQAAILFQFAVLLAIPFSLPLSSPRLPFVPLLSEVTL